MRGLLDRLQGVPRGLLVYLALLCLVTFVAVLWSLQFVGTALRTPSAIGVCIVFGSLALAAEGVPVNASDKTLFSFANALWVALVLTLPEPLPIFDALIVLIIIQIIQPLPIRARIFNVIQVPLSMLAVWPVVSHYGLLVRHDPSSFRTIFEWGVVVVIYLFIYQGALALVVAIANGVSLLRTLKKYIFPVMAYEVGATASGLLLTAAWPGNPLYALFFALPILSLKGAGRVSEVKKEEQAAQRHVSQLRAAATTAAQLRLHDTTDGNLLTPLLAAAQTIVGAESVALYVSLDTDEPFRRIAILEAHAALPESLSGPVLLGLTDDVDLQRSKSALDADDTSTHIYTLGLSDNNDEHVHAAIRLAGVPKKLDKEELDSVMLLSLLVGTALQNSDRYRKRTHEAKTDPLTGLANRTAFSAWLAAEAEHAIGSDRVPVSLILVDLDRFKRVNDTYGHLAGDAVLVGVARTLMATVRGIDLACRPGGDEFAVILPGAGIVEATDVARRVAGALNGLVVTHGEAVIRVGASLGVASLPEHGTSDKELYAAADAAAYTAKNAGRGCIASPSGVVASMSPERRALPSHRHYAG